MILHSLSFNDTLENKKSWKRDSNLTFLELQVCISPHIVLFRDSKSRVSRYRDIKRLKRPTWEGEELEHDLLSKKLLSEL